MSKFAMYLLVAAAAVLLTGCPDSRTVIVNPRPGCNCSIHLEQRAWVRGKWDIEGRCTGTCGLLFDAKPQKPRAQSPEG